MGASPAKLKKQKAEKIEKDQKEHSESNARVEETPIPDRNIEENIGESDYESIEESGETSSSLDDWISKAYPKKDDTKVVSEISLPLKNKDGTFQGRYKSLSNAFVCFSQMNEIPHDVVRYIFFIILKEGRWFEYVSDFDKNGVLYYLGTAEGKNENYVNPEILGYVDLNKKKIFQGTIQQAFMWNNAAPPIIQNWCYQGWNNDYGPLYMSVHFLKHTLIPTKYTIRQGYPGGHALRNWNFEASHNGKEWIILEEYKNCKTISDRDLSCTATFDVRNSNVSYQHFRIHVTGVTDGGSFYCMMAGFEIYGFLRDA